MSKNIWVLVDSRIGNANQAIDLARKISSFSVIKEIKYNILSKLPSIFYKFYPIHIKRSVLHELRKQELPDVIISSGRRTGALAVFLKKIAKHEIKIIQIMRPCISADFFEMIILPQHDVFKESTANVYRIVGALNNVQEKIKNTIDDFRRHHPTLQNFIAVLVGGSTKKNKMTISDAAILVSNLENISINHSANLFISFSRRTPADVKKYIKSKLNKEHVIYDPAIDGNNPYPAFIALADYIIITADSISMCSEAAATGKPLYIYTPDGFTSKKHRYFAQQLIDLGYAKQLKKDTDFLKKYEYEPLNELENVVTEIKKKFKLD